MRQIRAWVLGVVVGAVTIVTLPLAAQEQSWNRTLERIASGVVSIQIDSTRSFDTERNSSSQATGFVVDARARAHPHEPPRRDAGPRARAGRVPQSRGSAISRPVYRDPIHDFGFFHYDPKQLHFMQPDGAQARARGARRSAATSASSATTRASSSRSSRAPSRGSTARRRTTAAATTTTSTRSIYRPRRARRAARRARRSSTSRAASSR